MNKLLRSKKALSPVVAAIILIAVTVAVSIAVAVWMGALTTGFMSSGEQLAVGNPWGWNLVAGTVYVNVTNNGGSAVTLNSVRVGANPAAFAVNYHSDSATTGATITTLNPGEKAGLLITRGSAWQANVPYTITLVTSTNKEFPTTGTAV